VSIDIGLYSWPRAMLQIVLLNMSMQCKQVLNEGEKFIIHVIDPTV
jgi:hypothetical protein